MPDRGAIEAGYAYEQEFADRYRLELVPQSGAGHRAKLDVSGVKLRVSLKRATRQKGEPAKSFRLTTSDLRELFAAVDGPQSKGAELGIMGIMIEELGEDVAVLRMSDLMALLRGELDVTVAPTKRSLKQAAALPALLRED